MRQVWITKAGPPEVLKVREEKDPEPGPGEVRIRVKAAGINFADLMARVGLYPDAPPIPCVVGYEVSGLIDAIGPSKDGEPARLKEGDRVFGMPRFGGYTDTLVIPQKQAFRMPDAMTFEEGAALPVVYLTAYHMMMFTGRMRKKSSILIHSAAGGVGLAAIQLAKMHDCQIFGIASKSKHEFLKAEGVQHTIDNDEDFMAVVREHTKGRGVDLVLDPVGGKSFAQGYEILAPAGRLVCFGFSAAAAGKTRNLLNAGWQLMKIGSYKPTKLMDDNKAVAGVNMGHLFGEIDMLAEEFLDLIALYEQGKIKPRVDKTFSFEEAPLAHHYLHDRKAKGKVVLTP